MNTSVLDDQIGRLGSDEALAIGTQQPDGLDEDETLWLRIGHAIRSSRR